MIFLGLESYLADLKEQLRGYSGKPFEDWKDRLNRFFE